MVKKLENKITKYQLEWNFHALVN